MKPRKSITLKIDEHGISVLTLEELQKLQEANLKELTKFKKDKFINKNAKGGN